MRIAVVSDIHGNRTAFEAVLADLRQTAPDLILQGGDLADSGSSPVEIVDRIRDLGWPGVVGNTDEMLFRPESLDEFAAPLPRVSVPFRRDRRDGGSDSRGTGAGAARLARRLAAYTEAWAHGAGARQSRVLLARPLRRQRATPTWSLCMDHSASRSPSMGISIMVTFEAWRG
jgi:3',5'-cyclic AMP phosphodiesterase CpdA